MKIPKNKPQKVEIAHVFDHVKNNFPVEELHPIQQKAFKDILSCRTTALGAHHSRCDQCNYYRNAYNSCRNRHCPKCQFIKKTVWDKLRGNLPAVKHFHLVFTIPDTLSKLFYINQKVAYNCLFRAVGKAIVQCGESNQYLGAQTGAVGVLRRAV